MKRVVSYTLVFGGVIVSLSSSAEKKVIYGVGDPLVMMGVAADKNSGSFSAAEYLLYAMNFGAIRKWMHLTDILNDPLSPKEDAVRKYTDALKIHERQVSPGDPMGSRQRVEHLRLPECLS